MTKTATRRRRHSVGGSAVDSIFTLSESVALTQHRQKLISGILTSWGEQTNRSITELAQATNRQIRELTNVFEKSSVETRSEIKALATAYTASQKPDYRLWFSGIGVLFAMIGAAMWIISLNTENTVYKNMIPLQASLDAKHGKGHRERD